MINIINSYHLVVENNTYVDANLTCENCYIIHVKRTQTDLITEVTGINMTAIAIEVHNSEVELITNYYMYNVSSPMEILNGNITLFTNSTFEGCGGPDEIYGGSIISKNSNVRFTNLTLKNSYAHQGGAVQLQCTRYES